MIYPAVEKAGIPILRLPFSLASGICQMTCVHCGGFAASSERYDIIHCHSARQAGWPDRGAGRRGSERLLAPLLRVHR